MTNPGSCGAPRANGIAMRPKLLILLAWIFFLAASRTDDVLWLFCLIYCCIMALCAFFYRLENKAARTGKQS